MTSGAYANRLGHHGRVAHKPRPGRPLRSARSTDNRLLTGSWVYVAALAASFTVATVASPAGVSGAVAVLTINRTYMRKSAIWPAWTKGIPLRR
jgi:hypothetical protein